MKYFHRQIISGQATKITGIKLTIKITRINYINELNIYGGSQN
jgi:hypothetical protein